jgi:predicted nucleic acid-binding protein
VILVDTSAWIEYLRGTGSRTDRRLTDLVEGATELATTDAVLMEVLAGARDAQHRGELRRLLARCSYLATDGPGDWEVAADLYRICREAGSTVRALTDCLIAAVALRAAVPVFHADADFDALARHAGLATA